MNSELRNANDFEDDLVNAEQYGIDWDGPIPAEEESLVELSDVDLDLSEYQIGQLQQWFPERDSITADYSVDTYRSVRDQVSQWICYQ